ncbi:MAG: 2-iminoacetate synthase ThiH [Planctomycetes bacterium]|nr:2-iminoacetate synthase ThiH [Planctomycetota bacterium]
MTVLAAPDPVFPARYVLDALGAGGWMDKPADWNERLQAVPADAFRRELAGPARFSPQRLMTLVSPAAAAQLEDVAQAAYRLTRQRFGNAISLFAPLYVSNYCVNQCRYCGFNAGQPHNRLRLSVEEAFAEAEIIASEGFRDILLVSGEDRGHIDVEYLCRLSERLRSSGLFATVSVEIYIQSEEKYRRLFAAGIDGVTIFQETYERTAYAAWHPGGPKAVYDNRILASEAAARAGMRRMGLGVLLGLEDWRFDTLAMAVHADTLARHYWRTRTSFSFPRIRPAESGHAGDFPYLLTDADLTQMMLALRLCFPDSGITLSTRESPRLRDHLIPLCVTQISAGSKTNPGGYRGDGSDDGDRSTEQFAVSDDRSAGEMAAVLRQLGFDPVWKDWDSGFQA